MIKKYIHVQWLYNDYWSGSSSCTILFQNEDKFRRVVKNFEEDRADSNFRNFVPFWILFKQSISISIIGIANFESRNCDPRFSIHNSRIVAILFSFPYFFFPLLLCSKVKPTLEFISLIYIRFVYTWRHGQDVPWYNIVRVTSRTERIVD